MNKKRGEYLYELVGIIREKKKSKISSGEVQYRLIVELTNKENIPFIQARQDLITDSQIWTVLEKDAYVDKKYLFYCQNWMGQYRLINWRELKNYGSN